MDLPKDQDYELWVLLAQAREAMYKARKKELIKYDLSPRQSAVLFAIQAIGDGATLTDIARLLFRELHSTSELLARMEKEGLIEKVKDIKKGSRIKITLTKKGQEAYNQSSKRESIREIMSCLSEEERQQLWSSLKKIRSRALQLVMVRELPFP